MFYSYVLDSSLVHTRIISVLGSLPCHYCRWLRNPFPTMQKTATQRCLIRFPDVNTNKRSGFKHGSIKFFSVARSIGFRAKPSALPAICRPQRPGFKLGQAMQSSRCRPHLEEARPAAVGALKTFQLDHARSRCPTGRSGVPIFREGSPE